MTYVAAFDQLVTFNHLAELMYYTAVSSTIFTTTSVPCSLRHQHAVPDAGLRNLIMVLFAATTVRLMIENYLKYGIRLNPKNWVLAVLTPEGNSSPLQAV